MSVEENKEVARRWNEEIINSKNFESVGEVIDVEYENHSGVKDGPWTTTVKGLDAAKKRFAEVFRDKHPTWENKVEDIIGEGDEVAIRLTIYENGKPSRNGIAYYRFANGKIIDDWWCSREIED